MSLFDLKKGFLLVLFSSVLFLFSNPASAQEPSDVSGEKGRGSQVLFWKLPNQSRLLPDISLIGSFAGAYFRDEPVGEQGENPSRTGFNLQGLELALQSVIDPYVRADIFILFLEAALEVEEAYVTTLSLPLDLQIRAGKMFPRFGRQLTQHLEQLSFADYSRVPRYFFGGEGFSELGVEISKLFSFPWFSELSLALLQGENGDNFNGPGKGDFAYLGHWKNAFDLTQNLTLQGGLSSAFGRNANGFGSWTQVHALDLYLRWKPSANRGAKVQTEYFYRRLQEIGRERVEGGWNTQFVYQFARRFEGGARFDWTGLPEESFRQWALSPVVTFVASEFFRLRGQYNLVNTSGLGKEQHEAFLQMQFNMGPHGAHQF